LGTLNIPGSFKKEEVKIETTNRQIQTMRKAFEESKASEIVSLSTQTDVEPNISPPSPKKQLKDSENQTLLSFQEESNSTDSSTQTPLQDSPTDSYTQTSLPELLTDFSTQTTISLSSMSIQFSPTLTSQSSQIVPETISIGMTTEEGLGDLEENLEKVEGEKERLQKEYEEEMERSKQVMERIKEVEEELQRVREESMREVEEARLEIDEWAKEK
jgi:hypothetical protein